MFRKTLNRTVIVLGLIAIGLGTVGCDEEAVKATAQASMKTVSEETIRLDGSDVDPFTLALDIPFYIR